MKAPVPEALPSSKYHTQLSNPELKWTDSCLGNILKEVKLRAKDCSSEEIEVMPILSLTKDHGLIPQSERFNKRVATQDISSYKVVKKGQLVYNPYVLWEGAIHILQDRDCGLVSPVYLVWKSVKADSHFLGYLLRTSTMLRTFLRLSSGSVKRRRALRKTIFQKIKISVPPIAEQQAIANALQTVRSAIKTRQREKKLELERQATLMRRLFTSGTRGGPTKQADIGNIPESWRIVKLHDLGEIQSGGTPRRNKAEFYNGDILWVKTLDLNQGVVVKTEERITPLGLKSIRGKIRPINTVMIAMYGGAGTVGKTGILGVRAATNQAVCCIMPNPERVDPFYLLYYLISIRSTWMRKAIGTRKDPNIKKGIVEELKTLLPPIEEQHEIKSILQACDAKISALENEIKLLEELFTAMSEEFMTGRLSSKPLIEVAAT
jgi:type I restriction enzyme S subunit